MNNRLELGIRYSHVAWHWLITALLVGCSYSSPEGASLSGDANPSVEHLSRPEPRREDYVGSQTCAECHSGISAAYFQHPMGRASGAVSAVSAVEQYGSTTSFTSAGGCYYEVVQDDGGVWHHERLPADDGEILYDQSVKIDLAIGSGRRGRSYGYQRGNRFFQSPISWYSAKQCWDLSPGYKVGQHQRFDRVLTERCLNCHIGRMNPGSAPDTWDARTPIVEYIIGCERCHGPGASHVERYRHPASVADLDHIVNPAKLDPFRRDAVCHQCHLQASKTIPRFGRRAFDFRPGDRLADVWVVLHGSASDRLAVTQSEQMLSSTCYRASNRGLGCISCHDPHSVPTGNPASEFDRKCQNCHRRGNTECDIPMSDRSGKTCIGCHMPRFATANIPHTALTDHRILRWGSGSPHPARSQPAKLDVFDEGEPPLPEWEVRRAQLLALRIDRSLVRSDFDLDRAARTLHGLQEQLAVDPDLWEMLAWITSRQGKWREAESAARRALDLAPKRINAREVIVGALMARQAWAEVVRECQELVTLDPSMAMYRNMIAEAEWRQGHTELALQAAEQSLKLDPSQRDLRQRVVDSYRQQGAAAAAAAHQDILERWPMGMR